MATVKKLTEALRELLAVIPQYDTAHLGVNYQDAIKFAKQVLADKPKAKAKIICTLMDDARYAWEYQDGRTVIATFAHDEKYFNKIKAEARARIARGRNYPVRGVASIFRIPSAEQ